MRGAGALRTAALGRCDGMIGVAGSGDAREGRRPGCVALLEGEDGAAPPVNPEDIVRWGIREFCAGSEVGGGRREGPPAEYDWARSAGCGLAYGAGGTDGWATPCPDPGVGGRVFTLWRP